MKTLLRNTRKQLSLAVAIFALSACQKAANEQSAIDEQMAPPPAIPPTAKLTTPQPKPVALKAATAPATPVENFLAPEGVYFLTSAVSVETAEGITGLRPGTRALKQADGRYLADGHVVELRSEQLTNDTRFAARVAGADESAQTAIRRRLAAATPVPNGKVPSSGRKSALDRPSSQTEPSEATSDYVPGVTTQSSGLQTSSSLGAGHTRTANGVLWQKTPDGKFWTAVKRLDGKPLSAVPDVPAR